MSNMSYCMCENTSLDLNQVIQAMQESECLKDFMSDMSREEAAGFKRLAFLCQQFLEVKEEMEYYDKEFEHE